jgi:GT2 family glycosyltransferase
MTDLDYPSVSIVLLNYNGLRFVEYWRTLFSLDYPKSKYEIVFVDNGSTDGSDSCFSEMATQSPEVNISVVKLKKNCGYSKANNIGASKAKSNYIVLLSNDIRVSRDWLRKAINILELDKQIGVAQSMMYMLEDQSKPDKMGNYIDVFGLNYPFSFINETKEVFYSEGAVMFIRRNVLILTDGLFDETYFMFYEDVDFCWRARLMGFKVVVLRDSIVYHKRGGTVSGTLMKLDPLYVFTNTRNRLKTLLKNYSTKNAAMFIPGAMAIEVGKASFLVANGKVQAGLSCFSGILSFFFGLLDTMKRRAIVQSRRSVSDEEIMKLMIPAEEVLGHVFKNVRKLQNEWKEK